MIHTPKTLGINPKIYARWLCEVFRFLKKKTQIYKPPEGLSTRKGIHMSTKMRSHNDNKKLTLNQLSNFEAGDTRITSTTSPDFARPGNNINKINKPGKSTPQGLQIKSWRPKDPQLKLMLFSNVFWQKLGTRGGYYAKRSNFGPPTVAVW